MDDIVSTGFYVVPVAKRKVKCTLTLKYIYSGIQWTIDCYFMQTDSTVSYTNFVNIEKHVIREQREMLKQFLFYELCESTCYTQNNVSIIRTLPFVPCGLQGPFRRLIESVTRDIRLKVTGVTESASLATTDITEKQVKQKKNNKNKRKTVLVKKDRIT